ncbi:hypothetical protein LPN01_04630 [Sphingomonas sp. A2-49]|jgi:hypothetical protein|uniref:hypothetical protein n=1 Tax=Sphingomonas sp. A2-49 TaxID=1391375 RepID=UPI0021D2C42E|nr:hypothetical protein [Sphingomonas sp. A2-49]MCU6453358.1 hypothetical protein [Sphingomonas sp. A2-49]
MMSGPDEEAMEHHRDEHIASALGVSVMTLADYPFSVKKTPVTTAWREDGVIYGWRIIWDKEAPPGVDVNGTSGSLWSDIPATLEEPDEDDR